MKLSILLTSYNLVDNIDAAISSIVVQEMPFDWELLVGDDGSTDGTVEHVQEWVKKYPNNIQLIQHPRDGEAKKTGFRAAQNRAKLLERASGDYINYLDGDDIFLGTQKFKTQLEKLESPEYQHCSCCAHNTIAYVEKEERKYCMTDEKIGTQVFTAKQYWPHMYFHTNTILFRRKCIPMLLGPLYRDYLNDTFITFILLQYGDVLYLNENWAQYNMTGEGLWTGKKKAYNVFRNILVYDLELKINPKLAHESFIHNRSSILGIFQSYKKEDMPDIEPLVRGLDPEVFKITLLLYKKTGLSLSERMAKCKLYLKATTSNNIDRVQRLFKLIFK